MKKIIKNNIERHVEQNLFRFTESVQQEYRENSRCSSKEKTAIKQQNSNRTPELTGKPQKE